MTVPPHNVGGLYEWAVICDICGKHRSAGKHQKRSKLRQAAKQKERMEGDA